MIDLLAREDERNDVLRCLVRPKLDVRMDVSVRWQECRYIMSRISGSRFKNGNGLSECLSVIER